MAGWGKANAPIKTARPGVIAFWLRAVSEADAADWLVMAAYLCAAWLAGRAARRATTDGRERWFWLLLTAALVFLGVNKLLDLQALLTAVARELARAAGWYEDRRAIQYGFVLALAGVAAVGGVAAIWLTRRMAATIRVALAGLVLVGLAVLLRAATFNHLSDVLGRGPAAVDIGAFRELPGIALIAIAAWRYRRASVV